MIILLINESASFSPDSSTRAQNHIFPEPKVNVYTFLLYLTNIYVIMNNYQIFSGSSFSNV